MMGGGATHRRIRLAVAVCLMWWVAGCASSDGDGEAAPGERSPEGTLAEGASAETTVGSAPVGPSEDSVPGTWESEVELENGREQFLADCMADHGFEYVPTVYPPEMDAGAGDLDLYLESGYDPEAAVELAREYGFGMFLDSDEAMQFELAGADDDLPPDPNHEIFEALSQSDKEAYTRSLEAGLPEGTLDAYEHMKRRFEQVTGLDYDEVEGDLSELVDEDVLGELRAEERNVAVIDARCRSAYLTVQNEVGLELEEEVIEDHPEILDMLADSP